MLVSRAGKSEEASPFFLKMKGFAFEWKKFSENINGEISGEYNSYFVDLELKTESEVGRVIIRGHKKLSNVSAGIIPVNSRYQQKTTIYFDTGLKNQAAFVLQRRNILTRVMTVFNIRFRCSFNPHFVVGTKGVDHLLRKELNDWLVPSGLQQLSLGKDGVLILVLNKLIENESDLNRLVKESSEIVKKLHF